MDRIRLPGSSLDVARLGFGGAGLVGGQSRKRSLALLEAALAFGIRHFDVAPSYGLGGAEDVMGEFVERHRGLITLTTKFGSPRTTPGRRIALQSARTMLRSVFNRFPAVKQRLLKELSRQSPLASFDAGAFRNELEISLRALRIGRIDVLLLHDVDRARLSDELMRELDIARDSGKIGAWGIGSSLDAIDELVPEQVSRSAILQYGWSPLHARRSRHKSRFTITHHAIADAFQPLCARLTEPELCRRWSNATGLDLADPKELARAILGSALAANPTGIALYWSSDIGRVTSNAKALDQRYQRAGNALARLLAETDTPPTHS
jgi:aryl-alcohol dehydrogenase-like predicted oxidoreductase